MVAENNLNDHNIIRQSPNLASLSSGTFSSSTTNNGVINSGSLPHFTPQTLRLPRMTHHETIVTATPRRIFQNAHAYHINSISVNSDAETFISADDLRINLWNLNIPDQSFSTSPFPFFRSSLEQTLTVDIVDIKPVNMEELTEVITAAEFHPVHCNYFAYSSSKGTIKLADMRESALCDHHAKLFEVEEDPGTKSFFSEIISSVCDIRFSRDGRYILSRDFLTLKIWDLAMDGRTPLQQINIHDHLRHKLCDLYESDCIFDKFECTFSGDGKHALTGSYNNNFMIYPTAIGAQHSPGNAGTGGEILLQADKSAFKAKKSLAQQKKAAAARGASPARGGRATPPPSALSRASALDVDSMDFNKKILHLSWHPHEDTVAIAATNNVLPQSSFFSMDFVLMVAFPVLCNNTIICVDYHPSINRTAFHSHFLVTCVKFLGLFGLFRQIGFVGAGPFIG